MNIQSHLKVVVVGYGGVGKTSQLIRHIEGHFPGEYIQPVLDYYNDLHFCKGRVVSLRLWDTLDVFAGENYSQHRPQCYPGADLFLLLFDVTCPEQLKGIETYWVPEINQHCPDVTIILVASKIDLRDGETTVTLEEGMDMAEKINAAKYKSRL